MQVNFSASSRGMKGGQTLRKAAGRREGAGPVFRLSQPEDGGDWSLAVDFRVVRQVHLEVQLGAEVRGTRIGVSAEQGELGGY